MKKLMSFLAGVIIANVVFLLPINGAGTWKRVINKNGVTVYTRSVDGSDVDEFKGVTVLNAKIEVIGELLRDVPAQTRWMHNCIVAKLIKDMGNDNLILYNVTKAPWPVKNRDVVIRTKTKKNYKKGTVLVSMWNISHSSYPVTSKSVRMSELKGYWRLQYLNRNKTRVIYSIRANPAGSLPAFVANMASKDVPYETLLKMKGMVKISKYINRAAKSKDSKNIEEYIKSGKLKK